MLARMDEMPAAAEATRRGFADAVDREQPRLAAIAVGILADLGDAEDAVQDTLVSAWRAWDSLRDEGRRRAWLTTICVRSCLSVRRRLRLRASVPLRDDIAAASPG